MLKNRQLTIFRFHFKLLVSGTQLLDIHCCFLNGKPSKSLAFQILYSLFMSCFSMPWLLSFLVPLGMRRVPGFMELLGVHKIVVTHVPCFHQSPGIPGITFGQIQGSLQASWNTIPATPSLLSLCHNLTVECKDWGALSFEHPFHGKGARSSFHASLHTLKICLNRQEHLLIQ